MYLQKLKCPKCGRILGGKATTKKSGNTYYYYSCHDCKVHLKESEVDKFFSQFIDELVEYDSVVNQFFLPMISQKFDEPKLELEKDMNNQKNKLERIRKAYIDGVFDLKEYNEERNIVEKAISELQSELDSSNAIEELRYTPRDILLKRDIDFINKMKLGSEYTQRTKMWNNYTREEQADLIMRYVDEMRNRCIKSYNKFYGTVTELKKKQKDRNENLNVKDMGRYKEFKRQREQNLAELEDTNKKTESLNIKSDEICKIVENLKPATFNKNNKIISNDDIEKIQNYTKEVKGVTKSVKKVSNINNLVDNIEKNYNKVVEENALLKTRLEKAENKVAELEEDISWKDKLINKLQDEKQKFEDLYYKFSGFWQSIIKQFQGMIGYYEDKNYKNVAKDLYEHDVIDMKEYEIILDRDKPIEITDELQSSIKNRNDRVK